MFKENICQEIRLKNVNETRNYLIKEIDRKELRSKKQKEVCATLNYIEHFLNLTSTVTENVSISAFASLFGIPIGITSSAIGLKYFTITVEIKTYKSIINKKKKKHDIILLLAKSKSYSIKVLISKAVIDSVISHDEFGLINNELKEYEEIIGEIKSCNNK